VPGEFARGELYGRLSEKQHKFASTLPRRELLRCMVSGTSPRRSFTSRSRGFGPERGNQRGLGKVRNSKMKLPITWRSTNRKNGSVQSGHSDMQIAGAGDVSQFRW